MANRLRRNSTLSHDNRMYHGTASFKERMFHMVNVARKEAPEYLVGFLPSISWLPKYQKSWLTGDILAGLTVGVMVVPQSLAFATLAGLPVQYGLYTVFLAVWIYAFTGTCREVAVGPAAVISLLVGHTIDHIRREHPQFTGPQVAATLNLLIGILVLVLGVLRLGFLMDLIPNPVIMGFTTGTAFLIMVTQISTLFGVPNVPSNDETTNVLSNFFMHFSKLSLNDLAFGLSSLGFIVLFNVSLQFLVRKFPKLRYAKIGGNVLTVVLFTLLSYILNLTTQGFKISMVESVPSGFPSIQAPNLDPVLVKQLLPSVFSIMIIGMMEHVAICKAFARKSGYQIASSQELFAIGLANIPASFLGAYPAVGSFPTSAVNSQSGVRTPLSGLLTGLIVFLAMMFLTPLFFYIPKATLSAIIIFAALHLITGPQIVIDLWKVQPMDCIVFLLAAVLTFFNGAEIGIGVSIGLSFLTLLYRIARPRFYLLEQVVGRPDVFIDHNHPGYETTHPLPGVVLFRLQESLIFPNIDYVRDSLVDCVLEATRSGAPPVATKDKLWSDDLVLRGEKLRQRRARLTGLPAPLTEELPLLRAVVFDFGSVNIIDSSGLQGLFDLRDSLIRYAGVDVDLESDEFESSSSREHPSFEMHFVSTHPQVLKILELSGITSPIAPIIPADLRNRLETSFSTATQLRLHHTLEPIIANPTRYVHLTNNDALKRISRNLDNPEKPRSTHPHTNPTISISEPFAETFNPHPE